MGTRVLAGSPASPGTALGPAWRRPEAVRPGALVAWEDQERERDTAFDALARAAHALSELAVGLSPAEAEIVESGALMAHDPVLRDGIEEAVMVRGLAAADAILEATEQQAAAIAAVGDEMLAARADDVRSLGRRAARLSIEAGVEQTPEGEVILIASDLGPADVAELAHRLAGIALSGGGPTAHAAIVARSLGIPMVTGLTNMVLGIESGTRLAIDGDGGTVTIEPTEHVANAAADAASERRAAREIAWAERERPAVTADGRRVGVLANVATPAEVDLALGAGAEGVGLLRTELAFLDAPNWPGEEEHGGLLRPVIEALHGRPVIVRVLDFGADKAPPFLRGVRERGIELLLAHPEALSSQLRAIVACARGNDVRILLPMVESSEQVAVVRALLARTVSALDGEALPPLGIMIETPLAAERAPELARVADFFSIGTNDLTATTIGTDRFAANDAHAHDPRVLRRIARSVGAAHCAGLAVEVCGEAASDPVVVPLLVGLGVDELSVGAARVGEVRGWVRRLSHRQAAGIAHLALELDTAAEVELAVAGVTAELQSVQAGNGLGERVESSTGVRPLGP